MEPLRFMVKLPPAANVAPERELPVIAPVEKVRRPRFEPAKFLPPSPPTRPTFEGEVRPELDDVERPLLPTQRLPPWLLMSTLLAIALRGRAKAKSASKLSFFIMLYYLL